MSVEKISSNYINKITEYFNEKYNLSGDESIFSMDKLNSILLNDAFIKTYDDNDDGTIDDSEIEALLSDLENSSAIMTMDIAETEVMPVAEAPKTQETEGTPVAEAPATEETEETPVAETPTTEKTTEPQDNEQALKEAFDKIYSNEAAQNILDVNQDGKLSKEEKELFENYVKTDKEDLTVEDLEKILADIEDGTFKYFPEEIPDYEKVNADKTDVETPEAVSNAGPTSASYNNGGANPTRSNNNVSSTPDANNAKNVDNMSLEELQSEKTAREGEVNKAREAVNDVHNGNNAQVAAAQNEYETAKETYETALENDENISEDLKERQSTNLKDIESVKGEIDDFNVQINDKKGEISDTESAISADESNIGALESALSSLESYDTDDEEKRQEVAAKKAEITSQLSAARAQKAEHEEQLTTLKSDLETLEGNLEDKEDELDGLEEERSEIEAEILENCGEETKLALEAFNEAKTNVDTVKETELSTAESNLETAEAALQEVNEAINVKEAKKTERSYSVNDLEDFEKLYETLGLEEQGLNFEVFSLAMEGYLNLEDKGNGYLGIFDTTQPDDAERYYLLDLNDFELVARSALKIGSGNMSDIQFANRGGSHATLSGFEKIGEEYYSDSMGKKALRIYGLEEGINDNAYAKGTVVHYTVNNNTWGCKGFPPVYKNGGIDINATYQKMHELFPQDTIIFTCPTYADQYKGLSSLYA